MIRNEQAQRPSLSEETVWVDRVDDGINLKSVV